MDIGTLIGLIGGVFLIGGAILLGGSIVAFVNPPSLLIVVGGTIAAIFIMYPLQVVIRSIKVAMKAFFAKTPDPQSLIDSIVELADIARRDSLVSLEQADFHVPFVLNGLLLVADGTEENLVRSVMETELAFMRQRHGRGQGVFKDMGNMAPAFGLIGTLIGLIKMLRNLDDPSSIGPSMAVALLTTLYGVIMANLLFNPIAKKLEERSEEEALYMDIALEGVVSISNGENPRVVKEKLEAYLAPALRQGNS